MHLPHVLIIQTYMESTWYSQQYRRNQSRSVIMGVVKNILLLAFHYVHSTILSLLSCLIWDTRSLPSLLSVCVCVCKCTSMCYLVLRILYKNYKRTGLNGNMNSIYSSIHINIWCCETLLRSSSCSSSSFLLIMCVEDVWILISVLFYFYYCCYLLYESSMLLGVSSTTSKKQ